MNETQERRAIIEWINRAIDHAVDNGIATKAAVGKAAWPDDRSILGKVLKNSRRAQPWELAAIAAATGYPPYVGGSRPSEPKAEAGKRRKVDFHIKLWREHSEVSAEQIANGLGLDLDVYLAMEARPHNFIEAQLKKIAKLLGLKLETMRFPPPTEKEAPRQESKSVRITKPGTRAIYVRRK